mmetsp:Transcript_14029/g.18284  ORF Transcript_14029/g.18284 Transcript_14029/m.18284 type:complete len:274 (-) Transcript_14029:127-948(-)|eukprot:CAMPEP_0198149290 /NCGR_PEP_ID=MMETSP1443-20131203/45903_1 /TAXON_ID=186043 /ORGANISM="Entomoneis sp., Strain CCMP2396" /LENGTH=273 /DNA_ID=CAMNT_0043814277 /DNA_START=124 /DNA_END=945 /DNA_ORIENTATION=-
MGAFQPSPVSLAQRRRGTRCTDNRLWKTAAYNRQPLINVKSTAVGDSSSPLSLLMSPSLESSSSYYYSTTPTIIADHQEAATTSFEPVLNLPAFSVFCFIAIVFGLLQFRIAAIGAAADRRTLALARLRKVKALQLSSASSLDSSSNNNNKSTITTTTSTINEQVQEALMGYKAAYDEVERLRTVIPGVARIVPPPGQERMNDNAMAAQQFLNITPDKEKLPNKQGGLPPLARGLSPLAIAVLLGVATLQVLLLGLFTMDSNTANMILDEVAR